MARSSRNRVGRARCIFAWPNARRAAEIDELPSRERQVIYDSFMLEKAVDQIAASLETSVGNVRVLRHRAIAKLRVCMDGQERAS